MLERIASGYKSVTRAPRLENFASGFLKDGVVRGRPAGLATGRDVALYISDDNKAIIYRVTYESQ